MERTHSFRHHRSTLLVPWLSALLACQDARSQIPSVEDTPATSALAQLPDRDGDGVEDTTDNCPHQSNAPIAGTQPDVCGPRASDTLARYVSLRSRTFAPAVGLHPTLRDAAGDGRKHFMMHVTGNGQGQVLRPAQRQRLASLGVEILSYAPRRTYFVSAPNTLAALNAIAGLEFVSGLSPILPEDRIPPSIRRHGPEITDAMGAYAVEVQMFSDIADDAAVAILADKTSSQQRIGEGVYAVQLTAAQLKALEAEDTVMWIDDPTGPLRALDVDAQVMIDGAPVSQGVGLRGAGVTLALAELEHVRDDHPSLFGRIIAGNDPAIVGPIPADEVVFDGIDHANSVASIMAASDLGTGFEGLLPESTVISFKTGNGAFVLPEDVFKGISKDARDDFGATAINYSIGLANCNKLGEYRIHGRQRDVAIKNTGIVVVSAAGNNGDGTDCPLVSGFSTLGAPVAKNDIVVANVCSQVVGSCSSVGGIAPSSSAGPTVDGRLKPDLAAPGNGNTAIDILDDGTTAVEDFTGTSSAAPVVTGVAGWIGEAFTDAGETLASIPPERIKAILIHTAKDIDRPGPDYKSGYGLVQAPAAVRIAQEWSDWGREDEVIDTVTEVRIPIVIDRPQYFYKATLVWSDDPGDLNASRVLRNDLDLTLESPGPVASTYFSWDVSGNLGQTADARPCLVAGCDSVNNVEQVVVRPSNGAPLEYGTWYAVVRAKNLETNRQAFSLVLTPDCPLIVDQNVTLADGISCTPTLLAPHAVEIVGDAILDCNDHEIHALASRTDSIGVDLQATGAKVQHCEVTGFDTGIRLGKADLAQTGMEVFENSLRDNAHFGIAVFADASSVRGNSIASMTSGSGYGVYVNADDVRVRRNDFGGGKDGQGPYPTAIEVVEADGAEISSNTIGTKWTYGVELNGISTLVSDALVQANHFEGVVESAIRVIAQVDSPEIIANQLQIWGDGFPGIEVRPVGDTRPTEVSISDNIISGRASQTQTGISLSGIDGASSLGNMISGVGIGIFEQDVTDSQISANQITNTPASGFWTKVGIQSFGSSATQPSAHIDGNTVRRADYGITLSGAGVHLVSSNTLAVRTAGVQVSAGNSADPTTISGNSVSQISGVVTGISIADVPNVQLTGNTLAANVAFGISLVRSSDAFVSGNTSTTPRVGIAITECSNAEVVDNIVNSPSEVGFVFTADDDVDASNNRVNNNSAIGLQYASGEGGSLQLNTVNSTGAGISLRVGSDLNPPASCGPINVSALTAINNTLTRGGVAQSPEVLCDVDVVTSVIQP